MAPHAKIIEEKRKKELITKEEEDLFIKRHTLCQYMKNIKALEASQAVTGEGNKRTRFQTSRHPYKMTKDGKYGKLTIDVP